MSEDPALDEAALGSFSKRLASSLFEAFPDARKNARMVHGSEVDGLSVSVLFPSPTNDDARVIHVWADEVPTPSVEFGPSHTHFSDDDSGIAEAIEFCRAIMNDQLLIAQDIGGRHDGHSGWLDLRAPDALEDELTGSYSPGRLLLKSWSGAADREVDIASM